MTWHDLAHGFPSWCLLAAIVLIILNELPTSWHRDELDYPAPAPAPPEPKKKPRKPPQPREPKHGIVLLDQFGRPITK
jgi:energy-converting hydrogenase Eha subunit F